MRVLRASQDTVGQLIPVAPSFEETLVTSLPPSVMAFGVVCVS